MMFCAAQDDALILYQDSLVLVISLMGCSIKAPTSQIQTIQYNQTKQRSQGGETMNRILLGAICGLAFGLLDVAIMIPLKYEDNRKRNEAMISAFIERFMIGFITPNLALGSHYATVGCLIGTGLSIPTAIITRVYVPIIGTGAVGGVVIGFVANII
jgi:hypothetical protein